MIIDTSSILFGLENKIDVFQLIKELGYEPLVSKGVIKELEKIAEAGSRKSGYARLALAEIKEKGISIDESEGYVDSWIERSSGVLVCTNDTKLRQRLKAKNIKVFTLSRGGRLR